jgi:hypothetical protein
VLALYPEDMADRASEKQIKEFYFQGEAKQLLDRWSGGCLAIEVDIFAASTGLNMKKADGSCQVSGRDDLPDNFDIDLKGKAWPSAYYGTVLLAFHDGPCPVSAISGYMGPRFVNSKKVAE